MTGARCLARLPLLALAGTAAAQVPFGPMPAWTSTDLPAHSTGGGWADINGDGRPDLVIANGNDIARQRLVVYLNRGGGLLPATPDWYAADIDYHGHLSIADVNGDGYPDVAVSVYIGPAGFSTRGRVKLYQNNGGSLGATPAWTSHDSLHTFSCAFGDADGDGDPDLAVAGGEIYTNRPERSRVYYNRGGRLDSLPGWQSAQAGYSYDVAWADFDNDGDLDLVYACEGAPNRIYRNHGDSIARSPDWLSADTSHYANSLAVADINGDGYPDLAVSDNRQLGGEGRFKIYRNGPAGMETTPFWTSAASGYGSGIVLADIDADGDRDLIAGGWWEPCRIYLNSGGVFPLVPDWTSATISVVEAIACTDIDGDGLQAVDLHFTGDGAGKLFPLAGAPLYSVPAVIVGGVSLPPGAYWCDAENGWLSLAEAPAPGVAVTVQTVASTDLDFCVSNWDADIGNYLFLNTGSTPVAGDHPGLPGDFRIGQNYPNPFSGVTSIPIRAGRGEGGGRTETAVLRVYNTLGQEVATPFAGTLTPGDHTLTFGAGTLSPGVYFARLSLGSRTGVIRMLLVR